MITMFIGWIRLHSSILKDPLWINLTPNQKVITLTLLILANYKEEPELWGEKTYTCQPGEFITTQGFIADISGCDISSVRKLLPKLVKYNFLSMESSNRGVKLFLLEWKKYQIQDTPGWICLYRSFINEERWKNLSSEAKVILITIILFANHGEYSYKDEDQEYICPPGTIIADFFTLSQLCGKKLDETYILKCLNDFCDAKYIKYDTLSSALCISVIDWDIHFMPPVKSTNTGMPPGHVQDIPGTCEATVPHTPLQPNKNFKNFNSSKTKKPAWSNSSNSHNYNMAILEQQLLNLDMNTTPIDISEKSSSNPADSVLNID